MKRSVLKNVLLIGVGPHARRIYLPIMKKEGEIMGFEIKCIVDLELQKDVIGRYLRSNDIVVEECLFLNKTDAQIKNNKLSKVVIRTLDKIIEKYEIETVFICTEPNSHVAYAIWALKNNLNVLMDKPISAPEDLATKKSSARKLSKDYKEIKELYKKQKIKKPNLVFELMTQRRYHFAFEKMQELISEVVRRTGVPITSFQTTHCDGQWRMPREIIEQDYHPYNQGYGKLLHSGYHAIDIMDFLTRKSYEQAGVANKEIEVVGNFIYPNDFLAQIPLAEYEKLFGSDLPYRGYSEADIIGKFKKFGEIDAQIQTTYKDTKGRSITIGQFNLLHNSFSQRDWSEASGRDLYKGNGRIRHELHYIVQGPFQTIMYDSFQSEEILNKSTNHSRIGGEYHLDIHVFRNSKIFKDWDSYKKYSFDDFNISFLRGYSRGHQEDARRECIKNFLAAVSGNETILRSNILDQDNSIKIISSAYLSALNRKKYRNPLIKIRVA